jgi:hypothetical protein
MRQVILKTEDVVRRDRGQPFTVPARLSGRGWFAAIIASAIIDPWNG